MHPVTVFDLEFTAWEGAMERRWLAPGEFREVVQIGAVKIDAETLDPRGELSILVKPRINSVMSDYLTQLTGITNEAVAARGTDLRDAYERFVAFAEGGAICAFGRDDLVLRDNLALYGIRNAAVIPAHINIVHWLNENGIGTKGRHACDVASLCGGAFEGRAHDALEDARSVAIGVKALVARGAKNPFA
jgi:inhibitor of KinA sporulation pathway (predicted exonuclease)